MMNWHIGCSGFHYKHWKGTFYPEGLAQTKWFAYYCDFFNTLELNVTFYRFPQLPFLKNWRLQSPDGFRFSVKAPRAITHYKKFKDTTRLLTDFYSTIREGLGEKAGCILFQLPPNFPYSEERLHRITDSLDNSFLNVLEFRHSSWWTAEVFNKLSELNISFCGMSHPTLPKDIISNTSTLYYRIHGEEQLYASKYESHQLKALADEIKSRKTLTEAYIFFNNDIHTFAVYNALDLIKMI